jgi:hypothetical protein
MVATAATVAAAGQAAGQVVDEAKDVIGANVLAPLCSDVTGGESSQYPCKCGTTSASRTICVLSQLCIASSDSDGVCEAPICSNLLGGDSDHYPCKCGITSRALTKCLPGQRCTATDDASGSCVTPNLAAWDKPSDGDPYGQDKIVETR